MVESPAEAFIRLEIGVASPTKRFVSSAKDFNALRKRVAGEEMEMKPLAEKIIKMEMKIVALKKLSNDPAE
jgi:hypothetical protein